MIQGLLFSLFILALSIFCLYDLNIDNTPFLYGFIAFITLLAFLVTNVFVYLNYLKWTSKS